MKPQTAATPDYNDILRVLPQLPAPDLAAATAAMAGSAEGRALRGFMARWQGRATPRLDHPCLAVFAASHGIATLWHSEPAAQTATAAMLAENSAIKTLAAEADCDFRLYDMNLAQPGQDMRHGAAMTREECLHAVAYGMTGVPMGLDLLALASYGDGQEMAAAVLLAALTQKPMDEIVALCGAPATHTTALAELAAEAAALSPLAMLEYYGGREIAACFGAMIAARMAKIPVVAGGIGALAAAALLHKLDARAAHHVLLAGPASGLLPGLETLPGTADTSPGMAAAQAILTLQGAIQGAS